MATPPDFTAGSVLTAAQLNKGGLWVMTPTGATNGTVSGNKVTMDNTITSVTVTGVFTDDFDNYLVMVSGGSASTNISIRIQLGATTTNYLGSFLYTNYAATPLADGGNANSSWIYAGSGTTNGLAMSATICNPKLAKATYCTAQAANGTFAGLFTGVLNNTTQYSDLVLSPSTGTMSGGTIVVYGYNNG